MEKIDVSVIVPVYNAKNYIEQCLDSLGKQTLKNMEIIVIDDGSTDGSSELIDAISKRYDNMRVLHQENKGTYKTRAKGLSMAQGKYIGWVDADDFVETNMYEVLLKHAEDNGADCVICDYEFYPAKVSYKEKWFKEYKGVVDWNFIERNTQQWNKLVTKELLEEIHAEELWPESGEGIYLKVILNAKKIFTTNEKLYYYRVGHLSVSGGGLKGKIKHYQSVVEFAKKQQAYIVGTKYEQELKEYFEYRYIYALIQLLLVSAYNLDAKKFHEAKKMLEQTGFNKMTKIVLDNNYGKKKSFILRKVVPCNYWLTNIACKIAMQ